MDINKLLGGLSNDNINQVKQMANTPAGQELINQLKNVNTNELMQKIKSMDANQLKQDKTIQQLAKNPEVLKKISEFFR